MEEISLQLINLGMEMLNIEMQSNNIPYFNSAPQIKNLGDMMKNISLQMTNMNLMKMNNFNMGMPVPNIMNNNFNNVQRMKIHFTTHKGETSDFYFNYGTTIKEIFEKYCEQKQIDKNDDRLFFIYNAQKINKNDTTSIENFFRGNLNPKILALHDTDVIG